jgi:hypothetical protein
MIQLQVNKWSTQQEPMDRLSFMTKSGLKLLLAQSALTSYRSHVPMLKLCHDQTYEQESGPIQREMDCLHIYKVHHLVKKPDSTNIMKTKWVFDIKFEKDCLISSQKACLIAKGFIQIPGVNFFDT